MLGQEPLIGVQTFGILTEKAEFCIMKKTFVSVSVNS